MYRHYLSLEFLSVFITVLHANFMSKNKAYPSKNTNLPYNLNPNLNEHKLALILKKLYLQRTWGQSSMHPFLLLASCSSCSILCLYCCNFSCIALFHRIALFCTALHFAALDLPALHTLHCTALYYTIMRSTALCSTMSWSQLTLARQSVHRLHYSHPWPGSITDYQIGKILRN